jgi:hypothetical protein
MICYTVSPPAQFHSDSLEPLRILYSCHDYYLCSLIILSGAITYP